MKELQIVLPASLSDEEKHLKEMHEKLKELRRKLADRKGLLLAGGDLSKGEKKNNKRSMEEAAVATEELKKKIQSGAITVKKVNEKNTFKRARLLERKVERIRSMSNGEDGEIFDPFHSPPPPTTPVSSSFPTSSSSSSSADPPKAKESPWLSGPSPSSSTSSSSSWKNSSSSSSARNRRDSSDVRERTESRGPTLYVRGYDLQSESLSEAFEKHGRLVRINVDERQRSAFVQFVTEQEAETAIKEMDGSTVNGIALRVSFAHRQNI